MRDNGACVGPDPDEKVAGWVGARTVAMHHTSRRSTLSFDIVLMNMHAYLDIKLQAAFNR
jgi:hypothetical protein